MEFSWKKSIAGVVVVGNLIFLATSSVPIMDYLKNDRVVVMSRGEFLNSPEGKRLQSKLAEYKTKEKCIGDGWEWAGNKCLLPEKIKQTSRIIKEGQTIGNAEDCREKGFYWADNYKKCFSSGITVRAPFEKNMYKKWETVEKGNLSNWLGSGKSLKHLHENDFWEIKKHENKYVAMFRKEKINGLEGDLKNWDFPNHLIYDDEKNGIAISDLCWTILGMTGWRNMGSDEEKRKQEVYLYNENTKKFWNCVDFGYVFLVK